MKKIPSLFKRDFGTHRVYDEVTEGCEWVIKGEGIPTRKFDGTACLIDHSRLYKRYDFKKGRIFPFPKIMCIKCQPEPDPETGHWPWWVPIIDKDNDDKYHKEAFNRFRHYDDGTYELCGPKINGNPEGFTCHVLIRHGSEVLENCPMDFSVLPIFLKQKEIEGIVWHHPDGRMCKIKLKDFGIKRQGR